MLFHQRGFLRACDSDRKRSVGFAEETKIVTPSLEESNMTIAHKTLSTKQYITLVQTDLLEANWRTTAPSSSNWNKACMNVLEWSGVVYHPSENKPLRHTAHMQCVLANTMKRKSQVCLNFFIIWYWSTHLTLDKKANKRMS